MKYFGIFVMLIITACVIFPAVTTNNVGEKFFGNDGLFAAFFNDVINLFHLNGDGNWLEDVIKFITGFEIIDGIG